MNKRLMAKKKRISADLREKVSAIKKKADAEIRKVENRTKAILMILDKAMKKTMAKRKPARKGKKKRR